MFSMFSNPSFRPCCHSIPQVENQERSTFGTQTRKQEVLSVIDQLLLPPRSKHAPTLRSRQVSVLGGADQKLAIFAAEHCSFRRLGVWGSTVIEQLVANAVGGRGGGIVARKEAVKGYLPKISLKAIQNAISRRVSAFSDPNCGI